MSWRDAIDQNSESLARELSSFSVSGSSSPRDVSGSGPSSSTGIETVAENDAVGLIVETVRRLLVLYEDGEMAPEPFTLGPLNAIRSPAARAIARDIELRIGLLLAEGFETVLPYALSVPVAQGIVSTKGGASYALKRLSDARLIRCVGEAPPLGAADGTRLYVPAGWEALDPQTGAVVVEGGTEGRTASLVWAPREPALIGGAVEPDTEVAEEIVVRSHDAKPTSLVGIR